MTITTDDTRSVLTSDPIRMDTPQAWDLAIGHDPAAIALAESAEDDAADRFARARGGRITAQGTGRNTAMLGVGAGPVALGGLARRAARPDTVGWVGRR